jgi:hypothetical protein
VIGLIAVLGVIPWKVIAVTTAGGAGARTGAAAAERSFHPAPRAAAVGARASAGSESAALPTKPARGRAFRGEAGSPYGGEISLQETLDRLGYSVNVPARYEGQPVTQPSPYRTSTRSDAVPAEWFTGGADARFRMLGQQAMLAGTTRFGFVDADGRAGVLLRPTVSGYGLWIGNDAGPAARQSLAPAGRVRFYVHDTSEQFRLGMLTSGPNGSAGPTSSHVVVLPALTGGTWVDEGGDTGHWEGSTSSHGYLLCWEDSRWDADYQDMVVLVQGVHPLAE